MKRKLILTFLIIALLMLGGCTESMVYSTDIIGDYAINVYVDEETGVNYIWIHTPNSGTTITPRYNADGTLYVSNEENK